MRTRISVTVDSELVEALDELVKDRTFRSRSHGVEVALAEMLERRKLGE